MSDKSLGGVEIVVVKLFREDRFVGSVGVSGGVRRGELSTDISSGIGFIILFTAGFRISAEKLFRMS